MWGSGRRQAAPAPPVRRPAASIRREVSIQARAEDVWDALRDVGALHQRLAPGFVTDVKIEEGARVVTFGNGMVARELILDIDDANKRLAWSVVGSSMTHHSASAQVFAEGPERCRFVWIADLLPNDAARVVAPMMEEGLAVVRRTLERSRLAPT
jgi:hypothetical protein